MHPADRNWLIFLLVAAALAGGAWYYWARVSQPAVEVVSPPPENNIAETATPPGPAHPLEPLASTRPDGELVPLPPLDDLDAYLRLELVNIFGNALDKLLVDEALIDRFVATVDNLPRSQVSERIRPVGRISGTFTVDSGGDEDSFVLSDANFDRYVVLVDMIEYASLDSIVDAYRRYYPLFQKAYVGLGYPDGYFNDRVIEVIDHLLGTPVPEGELVLIRPHVLYQYADADLEALSSGQKLLLRMGNDQAARLRKVLIEFRARVAGSGVDVQ